MDFFVELWIISLQERAQKLKGLEAHWPITLEDFALYSDKSPQVLLPKSFSKSKLLLPPT